MAEAAISFAVAKLGNLLVQKVGFLQGVEGQVQWLKDELERMQCFLKDAAEKQANDERIRKWVSDIREVAQDADDIIESFILRVDTPRRSRGLLASCACFPNHVYRLDRVGGEIESIQKRLQDIDKSRERYGIQNVGEGNVPSRRSEDVERRRRLSPWQKDKRLVGLEKDVGLLLQKAILDEREGLSIAGIIGMGGIGKSTLARIVYNHADFANRFDCRAWVVVSRHFNPKEIMKELLLQLLEPAEDKLKVLETMEKLELQSLQQMLHDRLQGRRYFIVVDDVWENAHWEALSAAFPDDVFILADKASRLLFTSRNRDIPVYARYVHEMKTLDPSKSWELLLKKAFIDNVDHKCPLELENVGREILKKCNGLPLAITVVGGLLVKQRPLRSEWEKVLKGMNSHLGTSRSSVSAILELSYHNLPSQLRSCFLCLGFFKEDATIRAEKLLQVWIAEGLVSQEEGTMEEKARDYLDELVNRNMIQVKDLSKDNRVKTCQIHDLLRELSITKAKEEIGFEILREEGSNQSSNKPRHRAIYHSHREGFSFNSENWNRHIRSLFYHGTGNVDSSPSYWKSFELLRVLDLEDFGLKYLPEIIGTLTGLRYLGLRNNNVHELPSSLGHLNNLQVLDIAWNLKVKVPNVIWKMVNLHHLYMSEIICEEPLKIDTLKNLHTLVYIPMAYWIQEHNQPIQMTSLCKLGINLDADAADSIKLCTSLSMLKNLVHLSLAWSYLQGNTSLDTLGMLQSLNQLKLRGAMTRLPSANNFPPNLSYLSLVDTFLGKDPMPILDKLPKLLYLKLNEAYRGNKMVISHDGFPRLQVLSLKGLHRLINIEVGKGAMPELQCLEIYRCPYLESLPEELRLSSLQS